MSFKRLFLYSFCNDPFNIPLPIGCNYFSHFSCTPTRHEHYSAVIIFQRIFFVVGLFPSWNILDLYHQQQTLILDLEFCLFCNSLTQHEHVTKWSEHSLYNNKTCVQISPELIMKKESLHTSDAVKSGEASWNSE